MTALEAVEPRARVLIAADHLATRTGVRLALAGAADCSEAGDTDSAVATALREQPDVCVVDFDPPGRAIRTMRRARIDLSATESRSNARLHKMTS